MSSDPLALIHELTRIRQEQDALADRERRVLKKLQKVLRETPSKRDTEILIQAILGNLTQDELAEKHGVNQSTISRLVKKFIPNLIP